MLEEIRKNKSTFERTGNMMSESELRGAASNLNSQAMKFPPDDVIEACERLGNKYVIRYLPNFPMEIAPSGLGITHDEESASELLYKTTAKRLFDGFTTSCSGEDDNRFKWLCNHLWIDGQPIPEMNDGMQKRMAALRKQLQWAKHSNSQETDWQILRHRTSEGLSGVKPKEWLEISFGLELTEGMGKDCLPDFLNTPTVRANGQLVGIMFFRDDRWYWRPFGW